MTWRWIASLAGTVLLAASIPQASQQTGGVAGPRSGSQYKNLQVLPDMAQADLLRTMHVMRAALGVTCDYCHDVDHYDADVKPPKVAARRMIQMVLDLNKTNAAG